jgi:hypothetical protein
MKRVLIFAILSLSAVGKSDAYTVNGRYFQQISCKYQYNSDFGTGGYLGVYRGGSGDIYSWFFPSPQYSWCPY